MSSVLEIARRLELLGDFPALAAWEKTIYDRPAHRKAEADQLAVIRAHRQEDMRLEDVGSS